MQPILTIAGSDCSAGAGLQADLKTFQHFGHHGLTAVTCIVSETADIVRKVDFLSTAIVEDQVRLMLESFPLKVVKTGMLGSAELVETIASIFKNHPEIKLVIDPVMIASTGASLLEENAIQTYKTQLLPLAHLITPNLPEAEVLLNRKITSEAEMQTAALDLSATYNCHTLLKGGHLNAPTCTDILSENGTTKKFTSPRIETKANHGTGCTFAAAIASALLSETTLAQAISTAKDYLNHTLATSYSFQSHSGESLHCLNQGTFRV